MRKSTQVVVTFEIDGDVSPEEVTRVVNQTLQRERNNVGFEFTDSESFVEAIIVEPVTT